MRRVTVGRQPHDQTVALLFSHVLKCVFDFLWCSDREREDLEFEPTPRNRRFFYEQIIGWTARMQDSHAIDAWSDLFEELQQSSHHFTRNGCESGDISARPRKIRDQPIAHRIRTRRHYDGNRAGGFFGSQNRTGSVCDDGVHIETHYVGGERRAAFGSTFGCSIDKTNVLGFDVAKITHPLYKRLIGR